MDLSQVISNFISGISLLRESAVDPKSKFWNVLQSILQSLYLPVAYDCTYVFKNSGEK